jgi:glutamine synthetase
VLNLIVADQLQQFKKDVDSLIAKKIKKDNAILHVLKRYITEAKPVLFEGNSYSDEWVKEAEKRGLSNFKTTPEALKSYTSRKSIELFVNNQVLTEREILARYEIKLESFAKKMQIESRVMGDLAKNHIIPTAIRYQNLLVENTKGLKDVLDSKSYIKLSRNQLQTIKDISEHIASIKENIDWMVEERRKANRMENTEKTAHTYNKRIKPYFETIRYHVDKLELLVDDKLWTLPKYRELLFIK